MFGGRQPPVSLDDPVAARAVRGDPQRGQDAELGDRGEELQVQADVAPDVARVRGQQLDGDHRPSGRWLRGRVVAAGCLRLRDALFVRSVGGDVGRCGHGVAPFRVDAERREGSSGARARWSRPSQPPGGRQRGRAWRAYARRPGSRDLLPAAGTQREQCRRSRLRAGGPAGDPLAGALPPGCARARAVHARQAGNQGAIRSGKRQDGNPAECLRPAPAPVPRCRPGEGKPLSAGRDT